jgi:hypothetical protein
MPIAYPYRFSDWRGYDKDCTPVGPAFYMTNSGVVTTATPAYSCNYIFDGSFYASIYYHDGSGSTPVVGDTVYTDAAGDNEYNPSNNLWKGNATGHTSGGTGLYRFDSGSGEVKQLYTCSLSSFSSSSVQSTVSGVCSASMSQTYYHNGSAALIAVGDIAYSSNSGTYPYLSSGHYRISATQYIIVGSNGAVSSVNTCQTVTQFSASAGQSGVKFICTQTINTNYWHNGSSSLPQVGDTVYTNSSGTTVQTNRYIRTSLAYYTFSNLNGVVTSINICSP